MGYKVLFVSLFCVFFPVAVSDSVSLYPSETISAPSGNTVFFNCSFTRSSGDTLLSWNVSGQVLRVSSADITVIDPPSTLVGVTRLSIFLNPDSSSALSYVQCQLCLLCSTESPAEKFIASTDPVQVIAFGELVTKYYILQSHNLHAAN